jgi:hypothetical protein
MQSALDSFIRRRIRRLGGATMMWPLIGIAARHRRSRRGALVLHAPNKTV